MVGKKSKRNLEFSPSIKKEKKSKQQTRKRGYTLTPTWPWCMLKWQRFSSTVCQNIGYAPQIRPTICYYFSQGSIIYSFLRFYNVQGPCQFLMAGWQIITAITPPLIKLINHMVVSLLYGRLLGLLSDKLVCISLKLIWMQRGVAMGWFFF